MNILYGINTVTEALKARGRNFEWVGVAKERKDIRLRRVIEECRKIGIPVRIMTREELDEVAGNAAHQGLVAATSAKQYSDLEDIVASRRGEHSLIVVLDGIEDPHNLGAILRTADAAGADGVVIPERRSAAVTAAVAKVSAGASEHLPIAKVTNISRALEELKEKDLWWLGSTSAASKLTMQSITKCIAPSCLAPRARESMTWYVDMRFCRVDSDAGESAIAQCLRSGGRNALRVVRQRRLGASK